ncbi:uncharacterized protein LOC107627717 [Arachis ipaensis]|uniref:uncharacterized protein LOC107627717 n=1 Tax=Arachis ipaensis TaxID=130454 RepID=UPI0007AF0394|nr:uncharacterized protein LOC107627717 [Arachis ipaensis]
MEIKTFSELVNKSKVAEDCVRKAASDKGDHRAFVRRDQWRNFVPSGRNFKRGGYVPQQHQGQNNFWRFNDNNNLGRGKGKQAHIPQNDLTCRRCGKYHQNTPCEAGLGVCYYCGGSGHLSWNCLNKKRDDVGRAQQPGRVFTTSAAGAEGSETLIRGNCELAGKVLNALFDSGATHSFIAFEKANELGLKKKDGSM